jgi:hypothetical protein
MSLFKLSGGRRLMSLLPPKIASSLERSPLFSSSRPQDDDDFRWLHRQDDTELLDDDGYLKDDEQEAESLAEDASEYLQDEEETDSVVSTADHRQDNINVKLPQPPPPIVIDLEADTGEEMDLQASATTADEQQEVAKQEEDTKTLRMKKETNTILSRTEHRQANVKLQPPPPRLVIDLEAATGEEMDLKEESATVDKPQDDVMSNKRKLPSLWK